MSQPRAGDIIRAELETWEEIHAHPHRFGGIEFRLGSREIGHIHGDSIVDIPFPTRVRDEVVAAGLAQAHHVLPKSGWVTVPLDQESGVQNAIDLLQRSYELARAQVARRQGSDGSR